MYVASLWCAKCTAAGIGHLEKSYELSMSENWNGYKRPFLSDQSHMKIGDVNLRANYTIKIINHTFLLERWPFRPLGI